MAVYGGGGGTTAYAPRPGRGVSFDAIGEGWRLLTQNLGTWILTTLVYFVVVFAISFVIGLIMGALGLAARPQPGQALPTFTPGAVVGQVVSFVINTVLSAFLTGGLYRMAVNQARGRPVSVGDLFSAGDVIGPLVVAALLTALAVAVPAGIVAALLVPVLGFGAALIAIIPAIIVALFFVLANPIIVDRRVGGVEAMKESVNATRGHLGALFGVLFVLGLINIVGAIPCGLGLLVTSPLLYLTVGVIYRDLFPEAGGDPVTAGPSIVMPMPPSAPTGTTGATGGAATDTPPPPPPLPPSTGGMAQL